MQKLGQHFLKNKAALKLIAKALVSQSGKNEGTNETIIEIGPGHGELTNELKAANENMRIIVIEKDTALAARLTLSDTATKVIEGDALELLPGVVKNLSGEPYRLAGNIPYYITGHLLRAVSELSQKPERCVFTIQKEVAERIVAEPPRMNRLAASVQYWAEAKILKTLPAADFSPAPKVDSAIIELTTRQTTGSGDGSQSHAAQEKYYAAVRTIFAQPRKTILNNLSVGANKQKITEALQKIGIEPTARPQDLSIEDIKTIAKL